MLKLKGSLKISGDKSISHRALILAALSLGKTKISNLLESDDVLRTVNILRDLGIKIKKNGEDWIVYGNGTCGFFQPDSALDCGNSGTTARLMIGAVSSNPIKCTFIGDESLQKRPMSRVTDHLKTIGAEVQLTNNDYLPLMITGTQNLLPKKHIIKTASAQIKSSLILSGLNIKGKTTIVETKSTRDHTERLLKFLNLKFKITKYKNGETSIELNGPYEIFPKDLKVASDPSSAAFFIVAALITPNSQIELKNILLNPLRIEFINILKKMGGKIIVKKTKKMCGEDIGIIKVKYSNLKGITISSSLSPKIIDEYPILAIAATQAKGKTIMKGLGELRHKESDRIVSIVSNLKKLNFNVSSKKDDIIIQNKDVKIKNKKIIKTFNDHRIAMSFLILSIIYENKILIDNSNCISISYPKFHYHLNKLLKKY